MSQLSDSENPPRIQSSISAASRLFWSVMVPVYNPAKRFLQQTLSSVLSQDPGPLHMEIVVVDDCSPDVDVAELVHLVGGTRVQYARNPRNLGLARCWNACIDNARGEWIHILHQDDYVLPGFYERLRRVAEEHAGLGLVASRSFYVDEADIILDVTPRVRAMEHGTRAAEDLLYATKFQCPGVAVRRESYERQGGFRTDLCYALDCEMWTRIVASETGLLVPDVLACYRRHSENETTRLWRTAETLRDISRLNSLYAAKYPTFDQPRARQELLNIAQYWAETFASRGDKEAAKAALEFWNSNASAALKLRRIARNSLRRLFR